jgi:hypothetical protein
VQESSHEHCVSSPDNKIADKSGDDGKSVDSPVQRAAISKIWVICQPENRIADGAVGKRMKAQCKGTPSAEASKSHGAASFSPEVKKLLKKYNHVCGSHLDVPALKLAIEEAINYGIKQGDLTKEFWKKTALDQRTELALIAKNQLKYGEEKLRQGRNEVLEEIKKNSVTICTSSTCEIPLSNGDIYIRSRSLKEIKRKFR